MRRFRGYGVGGARRLSRGGGRISSTLSEYKSAIADIHDYDSFVDFMEDQGWGGYWDKTLSLIEDTPPDISDALLDAVKGWTADRGGKVDLREIARACALGEGSYDMFGLIVRDVFPLGWDGPASMKYSTRSSYRGIRRSPRSSYRGMRRIASSFDGSFEDYYAAVGDVFKLENSPEDFTWFEAYCGYGKDSHWNGYRELMRCYEMGISPDEAAYKMYFNVRHYREAYRRRELEDLGASSWDEYYGR